MVFLHMKRRFLACVSNNAAGMSALTSTYYFQMLLLLMSWRVNETLACPSDTEIYNMETF